MCGGVLDDLGYSAEEMGEPTAASPKLEMGCIVRLADAVLLSLQKRNFFPNASFVQLGGGLGAEDGHRHRCTAGFSCFQFKNWNGWNLSISSEKPSCLSSDSF